MVRGSVLVNVIYRPKSALAFLIIISLLTFFLGIIIDNRGLENAALGFFLVFFILYFIFLLPGLANALRRV